MTLSNTKLLDRDLCCHMDVIEVTNKKDNFSTNENRLLSLQMIILAKMCHDFKFVGIEITIF